MADKQFVDGLIFKFPHEKAPEFVKMSGSIKRVQLMEWLAGRSEEYVNFDIKASRKGSLYVEVNTWKPSAKDAQKNADVDSLDEKIPF